MMRNIAIIGIGGVGGYFGGKLCQATSSHPDVNIYFVARGPHLEAIRKRGLLLRTADEGDVACTPTLATDRLDDLPGLDLCLLCVKSFHLRDAVAGLGARVSTDTLVVPLLNGVDIYTRVREVMGEGIVFPSCVYIGSHVEEPGKVSQTGGARKIVLGKDPLHPDYLPEELFRLFASAAINYEWKENPNPAIWEKYIFIAGLSLVTAAFNRTIGEVMDSEELREYVRGTMVECVAIASRQGISLPPNIVEDSLERRRNFPHQTRTSFQRDFEQPQRPDERDLFGGTLLRLGRSLGIETPVTRAICDKLEAVKPSASSF